MRVVVAFVLVAALSAALTLTFAAMDVSFWPVALLIGISGLLLARIPRLEQSTPLLATIHGSAFTVVYMASLRASISPKAIEARQLATMLLLVIAGLALISAVLWVDAKVRQSFGWFLPAIALGVFVGWISGDRGAADPMRQSLLHWLSPLMAEIVLTAFRKTVHIVFYGLLALCFYRGSKALGTPLPWAAIAFSLAHGCFDEYRQAMVPSRFGTPWDLLFDVAGAYLFVRWAGGFRSAQREPRRPLQN